MIQPLFLMSIAGWAFIVIIAIALIVVSARIRIVPQATQLVIERLGKYYST